MKIFNQITNNISDWRLLIQHPNSGNFNSSEDAEINNDLMKPGVQRVPNHDQIIPMYCTILGLVIFCLVGYVIFKLWKQKNSSLPCTAIVSKGSSRNSSQLPKYSPSNKSDNKEMATLVNKTEGLPWSNFEQFLMSQPLYCLSDDQIEAIVFSLSDDSSGVGWVQLAKYHNLKQEEIESIMRINNKFDSVRAYLRKWSENPNHNLKKLIKSLHDISRPDTALLIKSSLKKASHKDNLNNEDINKETNNNLMSFGNKSNLTQNVIT